MPRLHSVFAVSFYLLSIIATVRAEEHAGTITA